MQILEQNWIIVLENCSKMSAELSEHDKAVLNCVFNPNLPLEEATIQVQEELQGNTHWWTHSDYLNLQGGMQWTDRRITTYKCQNNR